MRGFGCPGAGKHFPTDLDVTTRLSHATSLPLLREILGRINAVLCQ